MSYFVPSDAVEQVEMLPGVHRRTMGITDAMMVCEVYLERDAVVPLHQHENEQTGYVVYGKLEFIIGGELRECLPGDSYAIPANVEHQAKAVVNSLVIDIFSPPREDYR